MKSYVHGAAWRGAKVRTASSIARPEDGDGENAALAVEELTLPKVASGVARCTTRMARIYVKAHISEQVCRYVTTRGMSEPWQAKVRCLFISTERAVGRRPGAMVRRRRGSRARCRRYVASPPSTRKRRGEAGMVAFIGGCRHVNVNHE